jgi:hypothetical protein
MENLRYVGRIQGVNLLAALSYPGPFGIEPRPSVIGDDLKRL